MKAFGIIDAQRGFMPAEEGERLGLPGFGELPVPHGEEIVAPINRLLTRAASNLWVFTTQDWHSSVTAHFAKDGGMWPVHCVAGTPGALLHPAIVLPPRTAHFYKGQTPLLPGEEDNSYSGWNSITSDGRSLEGELRRHHIDAFYLGGLAFDYCVGATALDVREHTGLPVAVVMDGTRGIAPESIREMKAKLRAAGVRLINSDQAMEEML